MIEAPDNLLFMRHGRADSNEIQTLLQRGEIHKIDDEVLNRASENQPLTQEGQWQAEQAGKWLVRELIGGEGITPDLYFSSPYVRPRQTAGHAGLIIERALGTPLHWRLDRRLREHEWNGPELSPNNRVRRMPLYDRASLEESLAHTVDRWRSFNNDWRYGLANKTALIITHGHFMGAVQIDLEEDGATDQRAIRAFRSRSPANCNIIRYTSIDPDTKKKTDALRWVRGDVPYETKKGFKSDWIEIETSALHTSRELLTQTKGFKRGVPLELCGLEKPKRAKDSGSSDVLQGIHES